MPLVEEDRATAHASALMQIIGGGVAVAAAAGAFAGEVIGNLPGATGGLLNKDIIVPVRRRGSMDEQNRWEPDFDAVLKQLFSPENILKNVIDGGLKDLIKDGGRPGGGGGPRVELLDGEQVRHADRFEGPSPRPFHYLRLTPRRGGLVVEARGFRTGQTAVERVDRFVID